MTVLWTASDIAQAVKGEPRRSFSATGLSIDTRSLQEGDLFIPLKDIRDGHEFIPMAYEKGAAGVLSEREIKSVPAVQVADVMGALRDLAIAGRKRSKAKRIAVTGSVGKTSVKELLAHMLSAHGRTHKSEKSFNNHWGVPLTLAGLPLDAEYGVFETGMNHAGELTELSALVRPDIAIITKIAPAHLAHFDTVDDIAAAKAEIFSGAKKGGTAILSKDDAYFDYLSSEAKKYGLKIITIGQSGADVIWSTDGSTGLYRIGKRSYPVRLKQSGEHSAFNAAFVMAVAKALKLPLGKTAKALGRAKALAGRGEIFSAEINGKRVRVIDESYNANPESMRASIIAAGLKRGRRIAVLGDMLELGDNEAVFHAELMAPLQQAEFSKIITVGPRSKALFDVLPEGMAFAHCETKDDVPAALQKLVKKRDVILFKASNSVGLGSVVAKIKKGEA